MSQYAVKVRAFGRQMVTQFVANEDRGGYRTRDLPEIDPYFKEMKARLELLHRKVMSGAHDAGMTAEEHAHSILEDCADLANLALIVAENCNAIRYLPGDDVTSWAAKGLPPPPPPPPKKP